MDNLSTNILVGIDVIKPKGIVLNLQRNVITISTYDILEIPILIRTK